MATPDLPPTPALPTSPEPHDAYASLRHRDFRWFIVSVFTMTVATQIQGIVVGWQIYAITHDPLSLGLIGLAEALPFLSISLPAGHTADRLNRRTIVLVSLVAMFACAASFLIFSLNPRTLALPGVWPFFAVIFVSGIARAFLNPARTALLAEIIPRATYANAAAWRSSAWQTASVAGPAIGGLLYGFSSATVAYAADTALMLVALACFAAVRYTRVPFNGLREPLARSLRTGIRFVLHHPVIFGALTLDLFSVLLGGAEALLPVFASDILHVGPAGLGILRAAPAVGAVLMGVYIAHRRPMEHAGRAMLLAVATFAVAIIGFGLSRNVVLSFALLALSGMADNVSVVVRSTLLQILTPADMLGRVSAVNAIFIGSSNELGAFESGVTARLLGTVPAVILGGLASLGVVGVVTKTIPPLRELKRLE
ncbi:MAG TPA: MFS transporter [Gemmatimonadaceae bacterium]|nr:MFS transporter [Gemmatimonadaceae bacterium]